MHLNDTNFLGHIRQAQLPVLVFFGAEWCAPTISMWPTIDEAREELAGRVEVVTVNVDESPKTTASCNIKGLPSVMLWKEGQPLGINMGAVSTEQLVGYVKEILAPPPAKKPRKKKEPA
jgi:thioredoxin 1